ncbi:class I SAM-dependent methyltransferase [Zobellia amurskyensis]|uniref:Class I SAM-dependent methyltransferase n=1 Tax=Zobellia amurskyensis TaxID=248905 RepID=A0A7X2ZSD5_9FLAO|nr:methyltransferase domain-containing protein [Zobellia amurskyensis]MUH35529.1 class I SAM-dependent methyltransferase [Zobellia amurskyensis]
MELNEEKLNALLGKVVTEMGAAANGPLVMLGDKLGLYKRLAESGPMNSTELADETNTAERYVREWLSAQAASGYVTYDAESKSFSMTPEQAAVFGNPDSPVFMTGAFYAITSVYHDAPKMETAFQTGEGVAWGDHSTCLFCGTEKFFSPSYEANLISQWIPSLEGVEAKLKSGAKVADIGCGHAASTIIMAKAYPNSTFIGYDYHEKSIEHARIKAKEEGVNNVSFEVSTAKTFPGENYDLIAFFDCLHDMGDPVGACAHVKQALKTDGTCMIVEPFAKDSLEENLNPVGRAFYAFSTTLCTPCSLNQEVGLALGAQAGEKRLREVAVSGGFTHFRKATETPFNLILEART